MRLYERHNKNGATFYLHYRHEGRLVRERIPGIRDRKTAELYLSKRQLEMARGQVGVPTRENLSLGACLSAHIEAKRLSCGESHINQIEAYRTQIEECLGGQTPVKTLKPSDIARFRKARRLAGDSPDVQNRKTGFLQAAINRAVKDRLLPMNPLEGLERLPDREAREVWRYLRLEEIDALLGVLRDGVETQVERKGKRGDYKQVLGKNLDLYRLVFFLLNTGARCGEAFGLRWRDVDLKAGVLTLYGTKKASRGRKAEARHIPINPALSEMLEGLPREGEQVFAMTRNNLRRKFQRACELAQIEPCRIHDLRHTFASHLVMAGTPLNTVRELLGHSTLTMTLRYAHLAAETKAEAVAGLSFGGAGKTAKVVSARA